MGAKVAQKKIKSSKRVAPEGIVTITATFNNTLVTFADMQSEVLITKTAGQFGVTGSRKATALYGQMAASDGSKYCMETYGLREVHIRVSGAGAGRESAMKAISDSGLKVKSLEDITPLPHNGVKARKQRRC